MAEEYGVLTGRAKSVLRLGGGLWVCPGVSSWSGVSDGGGVFGTGKVRGSFAIEGSKRSRSVSVETFSHAMIGSA